MNEQPRRFLERVWRSVRPAATATSGRDADHLIDLCDSLLSERGEVSSARIGAEAVEVSAAATGYQNPIGLHRTWHAAGDDRFGHERGNLDADIEDRPIEPGILDAGQNLLEPRPREMTGEKEDALSHAP